MTADARGVLQTPMGDNSAEALTVGGYIFLAAREVLVNTDTVKRLFGNSDWDDELPFALVQAGLIEGEVEPRDGYGRLRSWNHAQFVEVLSDALKVLMP